MSGSHNFIPQGTDHSSDILWNKEFWCVRCLLASRSSVCNTLVRAPCARGSLILFQWCDDQQHSSYNITTLSFLGWPNMKSILILYRNSLFPFVPLMEALSQIQPYHRLIWECIEGIWTWTFGRENLKSLIIPPSCKFVMWLTLQNDVYFRGGRAASERLSAAGIGERVSNPFIFFSIFMNK